MNTNEFDKHIREKLQAYESPVDTQAVWSGVQAKMNPGGNRVGFFWWLSSLFILLSLAGAGWYALSENEPAGFENNSHMQTAVRTAPADPDTENDFQTFAESDDHEFIESENDFEQGTTPPPVNDLMVANSEEFNSNSSLKEKTENKEVLTDSQNKSIPSGASENDDIFTESATIISEQLQPSAQSYESSFGLAGDVPVNSFLPIPAFSQIDNASGLEFMAIRPASGVDRELRHPLLNIHFEQDYFKPNRRPSISLLADAGIGLTGRTLEAVSPVWNTYTEERQRTETPLESATAQLRLSFEFAGKWYFTTGLSLARINERFNLDRVISEQELFQYISEIHVHESGDSTIIYGTGLHTTTHHQQATHINRHTLIDIPITAGYNHRFGPWSIGIEGGIMVNLHLQSTGSMLHSEGPVMRLENSDMFRNNLGLSYTGGLRLGYQSGTRTTFYLQPGIRYIPGSIMKHDIQRQTYTLYGIGAGMAYRLR